MRYFVLPLVCIVALFFSACGLKSASPPEWNLQKEGIILNMKAENKLNYSRGKAYTLYLVIYQLINPNQFNLLTEDEEGLTKLLEGKMFDPSVASVKSMVVYPGSDVTHRMDRAEGARYVGVVAGYGTLAKERMVRLFDVPVYVKIDNILELSRKLVPGQLEINLALGSQQIDEIKEK